ncbi:MAG: hypothetical protein ACI8Q1_000470 [Parvicella sp.]|jgi:hypothetical protein
MSIENNKDNKVAFLVVSCDAYSDLWEPFFQCFFKYWPDCPYQIYLSSNFKKFPDSRVRSICLGEDSDYSTNLIAILRQIEEENLIFWFEDVFLAGRVDTQRVVSLVNKLSVNDISYLKLSIDYPWVYTTEFVDLIGPIPKGVKYRGAVGMAYYKKSLLAKMLIPGLSAWQMDKSDISNTMKESFYALSTQGLKNPPFKYEHAVIKGRWSYPTPKFLESEGLGHCIKNRKRQSKKDHLYIQLFWLRLKLYKALKHHWYEK